MTQARFQPFCKAKNNNIGYYSGKGFFPRIISERNRTLFFYNNRFCLIRKSEGVSFNKAVEELKSKSKIVDNYLSEDHISGYFVYTYTNLKK